jgi:hypothetical protein
MRLIGLIGFMLFMAIVLACWEIQIEGKDGWAANSPGWKIKNGWLIRLTGGLPVTGYHVYMAVFIFAIIHLPVFITRWSLRLESLLIGFGIGMLLVEDFFWFVLNPYYGIKSFRKGQIWWHKHWWGPVPALYWVMFVLAALLIWLGKPAI